MLLNGLLIGFLLSSKAIHYPNNRELLTQVSCGRGLYHPTSQSPGGREQVWHLLSPLFLILLQTYCVGSRFSGPIGLSKVLSRRVQVSVQISRPSKGWDHSRSQTLSGLGKAFCLSTRLQPGVVRPLSGSMSGWIPGA